MIKTNKKGIEFNNIKEFFDHIKNNNINNIETDNKEANDLYSFMSFYKKIKTEISKSIEKSNKKFIDKKDNEIVKESVNELIRMNSDGKFLRAMLIALGSKCFSNENNYLPLASAYETFQTSILIHDDIIDNAVVRRGKKTIPKAYLDKFNNYSNSTLKFIKDSSHISNSLGICVGDLGFYLAIQIIIDNYSNEEYFNRIINLYNKIVINTIKGEIIDVYLPFNEQYEISTHTTIDDVMEIYRLKTAWYSIIGPFLLGANLGNITSEQSAILEEMLYNLGLAFQIKDDILGIFGNEDELGKSSCSDITEFKQTIMYAYLVNNNDQYLKELYKYYGKENLSKKELERVKQIFIESESYKYATETMALLFEKSRKILNEIDFINEDYKKILLGFITYLDIRTK